MEADRQAESAIDGHKMDSHIATDGATIPDSLLTDADPDGESDGMNEIGQLLNDYTSLQAAHRSLVQRCDTQSAEIYAEVQVEMDGLRNKVSNLEAELAKATTEKEELNATVRDLRVRVEESRRAIMRLQGTAGASANSSGAQSVSSNGVSGSNNRRSMGPGALASWNPREVNAANHGAESTDDSADLKRSKRASLAFGPNAQASVGRRIQGHSRTTSGSHIAQSEDGSTTTTNTQGLRELTLGGSAVQTPSTQATSKRNSFVGSLLSPSSDAGDSNHESGTSPGSLLMPAKPNRRTSNGSTFSNIAREDIDGSLAVPSGSRSNTSPATSTKQLPISEADEDGMIDLDLNDAPLTARPGDIHSASTGSTFSGMQQADSGHLRKLLAEQRTQVQDRDNQLSLLQRTLHNVKMELDEAKEARLASEACLKALREFIKSEGGSSVDSDGGAKLLKGVKLPPLPTDKDDDEVSNDTPFTPPLPSKGRFGDSTTPTLSSSTWKSIGSTFAGLSRTKSGQDEDAAANTSTSSVRSENGPSTVAPMSPAATLGNSIGNFWSRSAAPKNRDSMSTTSTTPSEATTIASKDTLTSTTTGDTAPSTTVNTPVSATGFKGFAWFNKRSVSDEIPAEEEAAPVVNTRVASPPFANLDHNVITLDTSAPPLPDRKNTRSSSFAAPDSPTKMEPNGRTRKAKQTSDVVDEDSGFVPPAFQQ